MADISLDRQASSESLIGSERLSRDHQLSLRKNHNLELYKIIIINLILFKYICTLIYKQYENNENNVMMKFTN